MGMSVNAGGVSRRCGRSGLQCAHPLAHQSLFRQCAGYRPFPLMTLHSNIDQHSGALAVLLPLTELLPENYAPYRPLLADGLAFFLQRLSPDRQQAIVAAQIQLPISASREQRVISLFRLCPTLHKLGQVVAHDRRLSADLRQRLQELETLAPTDSLAAVQPLLDREVGPVAGLQLGQETIAEGSVAVVVPFVWQHPQNLYYQGVS